MAVDTTMRILQVPPKFMPYLEKHRIYELFHDLGNQLTIAQPSDPLTFLKQCLQRLDKTRDRRLIVLLTPPYLDRVKLAHLLSKKTGCGILSRYLVCSKNGNLYDAGTLAENTAKILKDSNKDGWILADFPDSIEESKVLIKSGVLPTHAFLILPGKKKSSALDCYDKTKEDVKLNDSVRSVAVTSSELFQHENSLHRLKELFKSSLKLIKMESKGLEDIANTCARLTMKMPQCHAPKTFRVVLMGPRGSKRRTLAKILQRKFRLVHVDMENLINAGRFMENEVGDEIRNFDRNNITYPIRVVFDLLKNRLYKKDCLDRGYVLTNFPTSVEDFVLLDSTNMPPNRVIFLDISGSDCQERIEDRVVNQYTGKLYSKKSVANESLMKVQTLTHPDDEYCKVVNEIAFYNKRVQAMKDYCGKTGYVVNARGPITALTERIEAILMGPPPAAEPRPGKLPSKTFLETYQPKTITEETHSLSESWEKGPPVSAYRMTPDVSTASRMSYPVSRMKIIPLIDSENLLNRYNELKRGPYDIRSDHISSEEIINGQNHHKSKELKISSRKNLSNVITEEKISKDEKFSNKQFKVQTIHSVMSPETSERKIDSTQSSVEAFSSLNTL